MSRQKTSNQRRLQELTQKYMVRFQVDSVDPLEVARWAIKEKLYFPRRMDPARLLRREIARALAAEYIVDPQGREVRGMIPVPVTNEEGQLTWEWGRIYQATKDHFVLSQQVRRNGILAGCRQHKRDQDSYNDNNVHGVNVDSADYDFNKDLEEDTFPTDYPDEDPDK
jgi:hypothetical protein